MKTITTYFIAALVLCLSHQPLWAQSWPDNRGTEFIFAFQNNHPGSGRLPLFITAEQDTSGMVEVPALSFSQSFDVEANQITTIEVPSQARNLVENGLTEQYAIHVTADDEVAVYGLNLQQYTTDAFLALPADVLGNEYIASSFDGLAQFAALRLSSQIAIVATEDNTLVQITPTADVGSHVAGESFSVILNRFDVYQISNPVEDLSGTLIRSAAPVAVMGGHKCADVPSRETRVGWCDHLVEMMPPLDTWGYNFVTVPLATRLNGDVFRVTASENNTNVYVNNVLAATLGRGQVHELLLTEHAHIQADAPVQLVQYSPGQGFDGVTSDPFMMIIPPGEQFLSSYTFSTPDTGFAANYINVVVPTVAVSSVLLDGVAVDPALFTDVAGSGFSGAQIPIALGAHTVIAAEAFGLYVYGFGSYDSYGYPGGLALNRINPLIDAYTPNISSFKHIGHTFIGSASDSEDLDADGVLDPGEDLNGNGILDARSEDINDNDILDAGEDTNANGFIDRDRGVLKVELLDDAANLKLTVLGFLPGASARVNFRIDLIDNDMGGSGTLRVIDLAGNTTDKPVLIPSTSALSDVIVRSYVSGERIQIDENTFSHEPFSMVAAIDATIVEWRFDTFFADQIEDLEFDVVLLNPQPAEVRQVTQKLQLSYVNRYGGERIFTELGEQYVYVDSTMFALNVLTDSLNYGPFSDVLLNAQVTNIGTSDNAASLQFIIEDLQGNIVLAMPPQPVGPLSANQTVLLNQSWNTVALLAGGYRLRAELRDSNDALLNTAFSAFSIVNDVNGAPVLSVDASIGTDVGNGVFIEKLNYHTNDIVQVQTRLNNLSLNTLVGNVVVNVQVMQPNGQELVSLSVPVDSELTPGAIHDELFNVLLSNAAVGTYQVLVNVMDLDTSATLATEMASFSVTQDIVQSVSGGVTAQFNELLLGDTQVCTDTVQSHVSLSTDLELQKSLVLIGSQQELRSVNSAISLLGGQVLIEERDENTNGFEAGEYACVLGINIGGEFSGLGYATFNVYNLIANPGQNQTAFVGDIVSLDGSGSREASNQPLTYQWRFIQKPADSTTALSDANVANPNFIVDQQGVYIVELIVNNGTEDSLAKYVTITVPNRAATANAGFDQVIQVGDTVQMDGSGSSDPDGDALSFAWQLLQVPAGSNAIISNPSIVNPTMLIDIAGIYIAQLIVNDGFANSQADTVLFNVGNVPPVADAGDNLSAIVGDTITLDGSGSSDLNGDVLKYAWTMVSRPAGSQAVLSNNGAVKPTFVIDVPGDYVIRLLVNDGLETSDPDTVTVSVGNSAPVANAGSDIGANVFDWITLDGRNSRDLDGDALFYRWSLIARPQGSFASIFNPFSPTANISIDVEGDYVVQLIVNDGTVDSEPDTVIITVGNRRPIAEAFFTGVGEIYTGDQIVLNGSESFDPDGDEITYQWSLIDKPIGSAAILNGSDTPDPSFVIDVGGTYVAQLIVSDGRLNSQPATVFIEGALACIENLNIRPKSGKVQLTWTHNPLTQFVEILRSNNLQGPYEVIGETDSTFATYLDENLQNGNTYYYKIDRYFGTPPEELECRDVGEGIVCGGMFCYYVDEGLVDCNEQLCRVLGPAQDPDYIRVSCEGGFENEEEFPNNCAPGDYFCDYVCEMVALGECGGASGISLALMLGQVGNQNGMIPQCLLEEFPEFDFDQCFVDRTECRSQVIASQPVYRVRMAKVPDVMAMSPEQAQQTLETALLTIGEISYERTTAVPPGQVIRQDVPRNSVMPRGSAVDIVISTR